MIPKFGKKNLQSSSDIPDETHITLVQFACNLIFARISLYF